MEALYRKAKRSGQRHYPAPYQNLSSRRFSGVISDMMAAEKAGVTMTVPDLTAGNRDSLLDRVVPSVYW